VLSTIAFACAAAAVPVEARDQLGGLGQIAKRVQQFRELQVTREEERQIGEAVSQRVRDRYGVVQDSAVHRYVTLVGLTVVGETENADDFEWRFIVLDTDAVNAFAAPGGFVHVTRGALALIQDEAELAGVLGHEIVHVTERHTIRAIQKNKSIQMGADETLSGNAALLNQVVENVYLEIVEKGFGRGEELESDEKGMSAARAAGYDPQGIVRFLVRLQDRNKSSTEKRGLFASHPEMKERLDRLAKHIAAARPGPAKTVAERYRAHITYTPVPLAEIAVVEAGAAGLAGGAPAADAGKRGATDSKGGAQAESKEQPRRRGFGVSRLLPVGGGEKQSVQASASGGPRLIDPERDAKGGSNPSLVTVTVTPADVAAFKKEGGLS
jgi:predicted Zn-dependent protease